MLFCPGKSLPIYAISYWLRILVWGFVHVFLDVSGQYLIAWASNYLGIFRIFTSFWK